VRVLGDHAHADDARAEAAEPGDALLDEVERENVRARKAGDGHRDRGLDAFAGAKWHRQGAACVLGRQQLVGSVEPVIPEIERRTPRDRARVRDRDVDGCLLARRQPKLARLGPNCGGERLAG
jgi:hypothetical protein